MPKRIIKIPIAYDSDVMIATVRSMKEAQAMGMTDSDATLCATAVSELATNIIRYAGKGKITLKCDPEVLYITARDAGNGIEDINLAMQEGHSGGSGLGMGLSGVSRMMDSFHIESKLGKGTTVEISKFCKTMPVALPHHDTWFDVGTYTEPHPHSTVNGDGVLTRNIPPFNYVALWDVSGHGQNAHVVSQEVERFLQQHLNKQPHKLIQELHHHFKGSRGLVAVIARLKADSGWLDYAGVGNVSLLHVSAHKKHPHRLGLQSGVIGYQIRTPISQRLHMKPNDCIIMHSDGICSIREPLHIEPQQSAKYLAKHIAMRHRAAQSDDMSCLVLHYHSGVQPC